MLTSGVSVGPVLKEKSQDIQCIHGVDDDESSGDVSSIEDDERGMSEAVPFSVDDRVKVWWPAAKNWYEGVVIDVCQSDNTYQVHYRYDDEYE